MVTLLVPDGKSDGDQLKQINNALTELQDQIDDGSGGSWANVTASGFTPTGTAQVWQFPDNTNTAGTDLTPDFANNIVTVNTGGWYRLTFSATVSAAGAVADAQVMIRQDEAPLTTESFVNVSDIPIDGKASIAIELIAELTAGLDLDIFIQTILVADFFTILNGTWTIQRVETANA